jgi:hypothetical protein
MKLEIERKHYQAGHPTRVRTVVWDVNSHQVDGEDAVALTPDEVADLIMDGQMLYYEERSIIRLKVLRTIGE